MNDESNYEPLDEQPEDDQNHDNANRKKSADDQSYVGAPLLTLKKVARPQRSSYQLDQQALTKYKRTLQKRVAWSFILLFIIIIERIFAGYTRDDEDNAIASLQQSAGVTYTSSNWYLQPIVFLNETLYFAMILTHFYVIVYYFFSAVVCLKIMYVHLNSVAFISLLEILFGDPRPYWDDNQIVGVGCQNSYGFPSFTVFTILFLFLYSWHCSFQESQEDPDSERTWTTVDMVKCGIFFVLYGAYCFLTVLSGFNYISQVLLSVLYAILIYYVAIFFDKSLSSLVEKSSVDVQNAKRYIIFWMIYIIIFAGIATVVYESSNPFVDIDWFSNYFTCLQQYGETSSLNNTPYFQLIGGWGSFVKVLVIFILLGSIFGSAKSFRDFKGALWYATSTGNKAKMTIVANICLAPSWVLIAFESKFIIPLQNGGIDEFLFNAFHFSLLYFVIFGILPKYVFDKWGLLNRESSYYFPQDEMVRIDGSNNESEA